MKESLSFDCAADSYDETRGGLPRGRHFARAIDAHLLRAARVLEVGVGTGLVALPLTELGHDVVGVDISPAMLDKAHARIGARVAIADSLHLPFATGSVNAVVAVWVLHVVSDREGTLAEIRRVVRPDGRLVVVPADADVTDDDITEAHDDLGIRLGRTRDLPDVVATLATDAGFDLEWRGHTDRFEYDQTPNAEAARIETRVWSSLWDVDDATWTATVQPVIDRLHALPDPDRPRRRWLAHHLLVFSTQP